MKEEMFQIRSLTYTHMGSSADIPVDVFPYLQEVTHTREEQALCLFARPADYGTRLKQYWENPEDFAERTMDSPGAPALSTTKTFRYFLRRFIRSFRTERLLPDKDLWLQLEKNGQFSVTQGRNGEKVPHLSETDNWVFAYLCFLHLRRFWDGVRKRCRYPASVLPVVIRDFSDRLDESVDYEKLLRRAETVSSQIIVLKE